MKLSIKTFFSAMICSALFVTSAWTMDGDEKGSAAQSQYAQLVQKFPEVGTLLAKNNITETDVNKSSNFNISNENYVDRPSVSSAPSSLTAASASFVMPGGKELVSVNAHKKFTGETELILMKTKRTTKTSKK